MANRYTAFVKKYAKENDIPWNCAVCEIKSKGLYVTPKKKNTSERDQLYIKLSFLKDKLKTLKQETKDAEKKHGRLKNLDHQIGNFHY